MGAGNGCIQGFRRDVWEQTERSPDFVSVSEIDIVPSVPAFLILNVMREQVIQVVEQYIDAVRRNDASALPLHPDAVCEFPTNTYRGAASFRQGLDQFARIMKSIDVVRLIVDGEHCVAILNIETVFGPIPVAEHIHVADGEVVSIRGYCDPSPMLGVTKSSA